MTEYRGFEADYSCPWMIIYPCSNRNKLEIAQVRDYEKSDWDLASRQEFIFEYDAIEYMKELASTHGIKCNYVGDGYLD